MKTIFSEWRMETFPYRAHRGNRNSNENVKIFEFREIVVLFYNLKPKSPNDRYSSCDKFPTELVWTFLPKKWSSRLLQHLNPFNELLEFAINRFIKGHKRLLLWMSFTKTGNVPFIFIFSSENWILFLNLSSL